MANIERCPKILSKVCKIVYKILKSLNSSPNHFLVNQAQKHFTERSSKFIYIDLYHVGFLFFRTGL